MSCRLAGYSIVCVCVACPGCFGDAQLSFCLCRVRSGVKLCCVVYVSVSLLPVILPLSIWRFLLIGSGSWFCAAHVFGPSSFLHSTSRLTELQASCQSVPDVVEALSCQLESAGSGPLFNCVAAIMPQATAHVCLTTRLLLGPGFVSHLCVFYPSLEPCRLSFYIVLHRVFYATCGHGPAPMVYNSRAKSPKTSRGFKE